MVSTLFWALKTLGLNPPNARRAFNVLSLSLPKLSLGFVIFATLMGALEAAASPEVCRDAFGMAESKVVNYRASTESVWPSKDWDQYLSQFPDSVQTRPLVDDFPSEKVDAPNLFDTRFFGLHKYFKFFPAREIEKIDNPMPELDLPESNYKYVASYSRQIVRTSDGKGPFGEFVVVQSKHTGKIITVPGALRRTIRKRRLNFLAELNSYLDFVERMIAKKDQDPRFDYFFSELEKRRTQTTLDPRAMISEETFTVSSLKSAAPEEVKSESVVIESFENGDTQRIATRLTFKRGNFWITTQDSFLRRNIINGKAGNPASAHEIEVGKATRRAWLNEIVEKLYPEYVTRRKWSQEFIRSDYQEVLESADRTRYIIVRSDEGGKPGKIVASIGLNRAPYSSFTTVPEPKYGWRKFMMAGGFHFMRDFIGPGYADNTFKSGKLPMHEMPVLKMERYLGVHLERPVAIDAVLWNITGRSKTGMMQSEIPTTDGEGVIYEPVKFYLDPNREEGSTPLVELVSVMADSLFPSYQSDEFSLAGQWLYTFNPLREGQLLYAKRGYKPDARYQSVTKDGTEWHIFGQSPAEFIEKFHKLSEADQKIEAGAFIQSLQQTVTRLQALDSDH